MSATVGIAISYLPTRLPKQTCGAVDDLFGASRYLHPGSVHPGLDTYYDQRHEYDAPAAPPLPLLNAGAAAGRLIDQSHRRGASFGRCSNQRQSRACLRSAGCRGGARFLTSNPQWLLKEAPPSASYTLSTPLTSLLRRCGTTSLGGRGDGSAIRPRRIELCFRDRLLPREKDLKTSPG
jgi:hypothetical protein